MLLGELRLDARQQRAQRHIGDIAVGDRRRRRLDQPADELDADLEAPFAGPPPALIEVLLKELHVSQHAAQLGEKRLHARRRREEIGREDAVEKRGAARQLLGEAWRDAEDIGQQAQQIRMGMEHREQLHAGRQRVQELIERQERRVGIGLGRQRLEQQRRQFGQQFACAHAAHRPASAVVPAAHRGIDPLRAPEADARQRPQGFRIALPAGKHQVAADPAFDAQRRRVLEQVGILILDGAQHREKRFGKGVDVGIAEERRQRRELERIVGKRVRLLVVGHLQTVLDATQQRVVAGEPVRRLFGDLAGASEGAQALDRAADADLGDPASPDQLLGLNEEFDLANAAAAEFDVMAGDRDPCRSRGGR